MVAELPTETPGEALLKLRAGERRVLSRALTLAESGCSAHTAWIDEVLALADGFTYEQYRVVFSGAPGAGKSTLIEALGQRALAVGYRLAVLAVDPSSELSGGSLLADKTRMSRLTADPRAFVRPSPNRSQLGGVTDALSDQLELCGLAGFNLVFVETVGVGQAEVDARDCSDSFALLLTPGSGDELQALKRGITEVTDWVIINKLDTDPAGAERVRLAYATALALLQPKLKIPVCTVSAQDGTGIDELWGVLGERIRASFAAHKTGAFPGSSDLAKRSRLFRRLARRELVRQLESRDEVQTTLRRLEQGISAGELTVRQALRQVSSLLKGAP